MGESQLVEADELPPVTRLDGKVLKKGELAFAGGTYFEVWVGSWDKRGGEGVGGFEKVGLSLIASSLLTLPL